MSACVDTEPSPGWLHQRGALAVADVELYTLGNLLAGGVQRNQIVVAGRRGGVDGEGLATRTARVQDRPALEGDAAGLVDHADLSAARHVGIVGVYGRL